MFRRSFFKLCYRASRRLPLGNFSDRLVLFFRFLYIHGRRPRRRYALNDYLYHIASTSEILDPLRCLVSDKEHVKTYIKDTVGDEYNVPTLAVLRSPGEIDSYDFPADCVIKPTHASAKYIIRRSGSALDLAEIKSWLDYDYYAVGRERNYRDLQPKVIVEPLLFDGMDLNDYKFYCFRGSPGLILFVYGVSGGSEQRYYTTDWDEEPYSWARPKSSYVAERPATLDLMTSLASRLSADFSFIRVDFYTDGKQVYVGELTNCCGVASSIFYPDPIGSEEQASRRIFGDLAMKEF